MNDYQPTSSEIDAFIRYKLGYSEPYKRVSPPKPTNGSLVLVEGLNRTIIKNDLPFALLKSLRNQMINKGYNSKNLKIEYKK